MPQDFASNEETTPGTGFLPSIQARGLAKRYGSHEAVADISLDFRPGRLVGILGPNGSGKSTTLRMLLGLTEPTSGGSSIQGRPYRELKEPLKTVGAALDGQAFLGGRSGRQHLRCWAPLAGASDCRVEELLDLVGLKKAARRSVKGYSLGMKQRLALATALLGDPEILILDEPANGLDPEGILWLRQTLRGFVDEGRTVILASHMLAEAQLMVDDVVMIREGGLLYQGTLDELLDRVPANESGRRASLEDAYLWLAQGDAEGVSV